MSSSLDKDRVKVCILTSVHPPFDGRIFHKEATTLVKAGYKVVLIAQHSKEETVDGVRIVPLPTPKNRFERMTKVVWKLFRLALKEKAEIYHFHDPELVPIALILKLVGKKVIYDIHELFFSIVEDKAWLGYKFLRKAAQLAYLLMEKIAVRTFDQLILVVDIQEDYYKQTYKNSCKYTVVKNYPFLSLINNTPAIAHINKRKPIIIYAGGLSESRGTKEIIQAMKFLGDKAELWLVGKWEVKKYKKECEDLEGWKYTEYLGLVPLGEVHKYMKAADMGICILRPTKNFIASLPSKAFEYMACSLPLVMSNFPYWQEIFGECALFANPYDAEDITEKVSYILAHPDKADEMGKRGRRLVEEKYNWEKESNKLIRIYQDLLE